MARRRDRFDKEQDERNDVLTDLQSKNDFGGDNSFSLDALTSNPDATDEMPQTASDIADRAYGSKIGHDDPFAKLSSREKIYRRPIEDIHPHRMQPRRAIPTSLRHHWNGESDADSLAYLFERWLEEVNLERRQNNIDAPFPLDDLLVGASTERVEFVEGKDDNQLEQIAAAPKRHPKEVALMRLVDLAASIRRDGLTNPISVAKMGRVYEIETGERRWLAFHLLNWRIGDIEGDDWTRIPVREVEHVNIWRQANENNARADLNAIGKARQLALLLMDLIDQSFAPFTNFNHEQDFYAQVSDGNAFRVPRGTGENVVNAMGLSDGGQLRHYRRLLRLPQIVWDLADDLNWTESFIQRKILAPAQSDDDQIRLAIRAAKADGYTVPTMNAYDHLLQQNPKPKKFKTKYTSAAFRRKLAPKMFKFIERMSKKDRNATIDELIDQLQKLRDD